MIPYPYVVKIEKIIDVAFNIGAHIRKLNYYIFICAEALNG